jgi:radical SAM protein with 4Fe4S-binding SPASM domain
MVALWKFLREQNIIPYFEMLTPQGRLMENQDFIVGGEEVKPVFDQIAAYEHTLGNDWTPQPPLVGSKCLRHLYSCYVSISGDVYPCVGITSSMGNIRSAPLAQLLAKSQVISDLKRFRETIKEPCHSCPQAATCYGCRGATYQLTGDYLAADPMCWRNQNRQNQITRLPCSCEGLVPHAKPIRMVEQLVSTGNTAVVRLTVRPDNPYLNAAGVLERAVYPEIAAQATAACDAFRHSGKVRPGFLAQVSRIDFSSDAKIGETLDVTITEKDIFESWTIIGFTIDCGLRPVAAGDLKLYLLNGAQA